MHPSPRELQQMLSEARSLELVRAPDQVEHRFRAAEGFTFSSRLRSSPITWARMAEWPTKEPTFGPSGSPSRCARYSPSEFQSFLRSSSERTAS
jgi:hypothetical protein